VSFHGLLQSPARLSPAEIRAKILVFHGHDDPMVSPEQVLAFEKEMSQQRADWQIHTFGNTKHAFTNPEANDLDFGTVYNKLSDDRSWKSMAQFFEEVFV
jgi:dienelactone hydrolase